jgi:hypothetical protein
MENKNIYTMKFKEFIFEATKTDIKTLKKSMPLQKVKHSKRVANLIKLLTVSQDVHNAALYHDFLERGGSIDVLKNMVSSYSIKLVEFLTYYDNDVKLSKNKSLDILKERFKDIDTKTKNDIIEIKICDRIDNLLRKKELNKLSNKYLLKSQELFDFLISSYDGNKNKLLNFTQPYFSEILEKA